MLDCCVTGLEGGEEGSCLGVGTVSGGSLVETEELRSKVSLECEASKGSDGIEVELFSCEDHWGVMEGGNEAACLAFL